MAAHISLGKGVISSTASALTRQLSTLFLYMVAARMLSPEAIGVFALTAAIVLLLEYAVYDSISESIVQRVDLTLHHVGAAIFMSLVLAAGIAIFGFASADWFAEVFGMPEMAGLLPVMSVSVMVICISSVHAGILRREARFQEIALLAAVAAIIATTVGIALFLSGSGLRALVVYFACEKAVLCVGTVWLAWSQPIRRFSYSHVTDLLPYAAAIGGQRMASYSRGQMDRLIIGAIWGAGVLGVYQIAARIFDALQAAVLAPTAKLFFVTYTRAQMDRDQLREIFTRSLQAAALIAFPAFLGVSAVARELIMLLFGAQWESSAIILEVLGFGGVVLTLSVMSGAVLSALGRARDFLAVEILSAVVGFGLLVLLSRLSLVWMAAAFALREAVAAAVYVRLLKSMLQLTARDYLACFLPCLVAAAAMWGTVIFLDASVDLPLLPLLLVKIATGAAVYIIIMLVLGRSLLTDTASLLFGAESRREGGGV